jgi:hypothetical protein
MGVSLPSDLIVDVMRSADPAKLERATAKLQSLDPSTSDPAAFASVLENVDMLQAGSGVAPQRGLTADPHVDFERMVLRSMLESLLPAETSGAFGSGPSAGIWRSLAADQLAGVYAGAGGIGVASALAEGDAGSILTLERQWPYFTAAEIKAYAG